MHLFCWNFLLIFGCNSFSYLTIYTLKWSWQQSKNGIAIQLIQIVLFLKKRNRLNQNKCENDKSLNVFTPKEFVSSMNLLTFCSQIELTMTKWRVLFCFVFYEKKEEKQQIIVLAILCKWCILLILSLSIFCRCKTNKMTQSHLQIIVFRRVYILNIRVSYF